MKTVVIAILAVLLAGSLAGNYLEYKRYSSSRPIVRIGDRVITRKTYEDELDYKGGKPVLTRLAIQTLINWGATRDGVLATAKDVDDRIAQITRRNPSAIEAARRDPNKMSDLRKDLETEIEFENIRTKGIKLSDADVAAFYAAHKADFGVPLQVKTTIAVTANAVDASTAAEMLRQNMSPDVISRQPRIRVVGSKGFALPAQLPAELTTRLSQAVHGLPVGGVATVPAGRDFIILRVASRSTAEVPAFASVKPEVEHLAKLAKAKPAAEVLGQLYHDANVTFEVDKYAPYLSDIAASADKYSGDKPGGKIGEGAGAGTAR